jgi:hypothetical protein
MRTVVLTVCLAGGRRGVVLMRCATCVPFPGVSACRPTDTLRFLAPWSAVVYCWEWRVYWFPCHCGAPAGYRCYAVAIMQHGAPLLDNIGRLERRSVNWLRDNSWTPRTLPLARHIVYA